MSDDRTTPAVGHRRIPIWAWILCVLIAVWLMAALYGQMIRDGLVRKDKTSAAAGIEATGGEKEPDVEAEGTLVSDGARKVDVAPPVDEASDRGQEVLLLSAKRCGGLHASFQARVVSEGRCEVYLHDLTRQDSAILIMASPRYGVQHNGRPIITLLPEAAYPSR